jgi:large subunit ribosomal protein L23
MLEVNKMNEDECYKIIMRPSISENSFNLIEENNTLTFVVDLKATKPQIKDAIQTLFKVKVEKVNTMITMKGLKKAFVKLHPNDNASNIAIKLKLF